MNVTKILSLPIAAVVGLSLTVGPAHIASAETPTHATGQSDSSTDVTHGELYDTLKNSDLKAEDSVVDGMEVTTFTPKNGISLTIPKPTTSEDGTLGPQVSGKMNKNGEPVIYLNQKDQKLLAKVGKAALGGLLAVLPGGKIERILSGALGVSVVDYISGKGTCPGGKSLRITGTAGGDALKEMKCV